jgi:pimeloyl-ACP methyl ester carboxylesterase
MDEIVSDGLHLAANWSRPPGIAKVPALILLPGFPRGTGGAAMSGHTYPPLADRVAREAAWAALTFQYRGTGGSGGDFSIDGWLADLHAAVDAVCSRDDISGVWLAGFRLSGALAIVAAASDERVRGIATFAAPESLTSWIDDPERFLQYCKRVGVVRTEGFPPDVDAWGGAISGLDVRAAARSIAPRPWLLVHGSDDDVVPLEHARSLAAIAGPSAELRIVLHGAHRLRHDPRAVAMLLGWLDRQVT